MAPVFETWLFPTRRPALALIFAPKLPASDAYPNSIRNRVDKLREDVKAKRAAEKQRRQPWRTVRVLWV